MQVASSNMAVARQGQPVQCPFAHDAYVGTSCERLVGIHGLGCNALEPTLGIL